MWVELALLCVVWAVFRLLPACLKPPGFDSDAHFYFYRQLKTTGRSPFAGVPTNVVHSNEAKLPLLWHWLLTLVPFELTYAFCKYINALIELAFCLAGYLLLSTLMADNYAFWVVILYLTTPLWFSTLAIGPRIVGFTPRLSCEILLSTFFLLVTLGNTIPLYMSLSLLTVIAFVTILSFKFGLQAIVFISGLYALMTFDVTPVVAIMIAAVLANWVSGGYFFDALRNQVEHLIWYFNMVRRGEGAISQRNAMRAFPVYEPNQAKRFIAGAMNSLFVSNSYTIVLLKLPVLMVLLGFYIATLMTPDAALLSTGAFFVVLSAAIIFLLTSSRLFLFLGEAERYLNCIALLICVELVNYCVAYGQTYLLYLLTGYGLAIFVLEYLLYPKLTGQSVMVKDAKDDLTVLNWLANHRGPLTLLLYPYHAATGLWRILGRTEHKLVFCFNLNKAFAERFESRYAATYPFTNLHKIDEMADDFGLNCVVIDKSKLPGNVDFSARWQRVDVQCENYLILVEQGI
ncbi:hypothetical protein EXU34_00780 [Alteromonas sp. ZYF713]|nr:hypothetical protein [Alteromonas sp. ZYF713]